MSVLEAIGLGALQGATEFLPVSSSGHLTLAEMALGIDAEKAVTLDVFLPGATFCALSVYFGRTWVRRLRAQPRLVVTKRGLVGGGDIRPPQPPRPRSYS